jgi:hypothetical protein
VADNGDIVRKITISATGENIDSTKASIDGLSAATSKLSDATAAASVQHDSFADTLLKVAVGAAAATAAYYTYTKMLSAAVDMSEAMGSATLRLVAAITPEAISAYAVSWQETTNTLAAYVDIANKAAALGVSTGFYQQQSVAIVALKGNISDLVTEMKTLQKATADQLGGSTGFNRLDELTTGSKTPNNDDGTLKANNGNFQDNTGVEALKTATSTEAQYTAIVSLVHQAMDAGERLAAIDVTKTFLGQDAADNLAKDWEYLDKMQQAAATVGNKQLVGDDDISNALQLQNRLQAAYDIIDKDWFPAQDGRLNPAVVFFKGIWVDIVEIIASGFTTVEAWVDKLLSIPSSLWEGVKNLYAVTTTGFPQQFGPDAPTQTPMQSATSRLTAGLNNPATVSQSSDQLFSFSNHLQNQQYQDKSTDPTKDIKDTTDAVDKAINSLNKHTQATLADADAVGLGAAALAGFKADAAENAAVTANGNKETDEQIDKFSDLKDAAIAAADALAKANVASQISRGSQTAFLSPADLAIANELKTIYGDNIPAALNSSQAAALRLNNVLSTINTTIRNAATTGVDDFVAGLVKGETAMQALKDAATDVGKALTNAGLNSLVTTGLNALAPTASQTAGATASASILTTAGTALAASMVEGANLAAGILGTGGAAAGTATAAGGGVAGAAVGTGGTVAGATVATGGAVAGTALTAGGVAAGAALWGPIAALAAVAVGIGASLFGGTSADQQAKDANNTSQANQVTQTNADALTRQQQDQQDQLSAQLSMSTDPNSLNGQLAAFDLSAAEQRVAEIQKGDGAIVELESSLAAQRLAIIQKSNEAITTSMNDFLNSVAIGAQSTLSPAAQLAYEQNLFNTQLSGAQGGNSTDLNALTTTAGALLTLAQNFYASGTGYADTYTQVTNAIASIAANPNQSVSTDGGITGITSDNSLVLVNAGNGLQAAKTVSGMAEGGFVGNGIYNKDSVLARYAGGGNIALAGGEAVTRASSVNANTIGMLNHINKTGKTPGNDNSDVVRVLTQGFNGQTQVLSDKLDRLAATVEGLTDTTRLTNNKRRVPGTKAA